MGSRSRREGLRRPDGEENPAIDAVGGWSDVRFGDDAFEPRFLSFRVVREDDERSIERRLSKEGWELRIVDEPICVVVEVLDAP